MHGEAAGRRRRCAEDRDDLGAAGRVPDEAPRLAAGPGLGLCAGLFVTAGVEAGTRNPLISSTVLLVLVVGVLVGGTFFLGLRARTREQAAGAEPPTWVHAAYAGAWVLSVAAAILALFGAGGLKVAVLAIVPIVLLAPPALVGIRSLLRRSPQKVEEHG